MADAGTGAEPQADAGPDTDAVVVEVERRDFGHVVFVIGPDAASVGRAVREESSGSAVRVLAFVGAPDHPALSEMLAELGPEPSETPRS
jgi:hypothetical protein